MGYKDDLEIREERVQCTISPLFRITPEIHGINRNYTTRLGSQLILRNSNWPYPKQKTNGGDTIRNWSLTETKI